MPTLAMEGSGGGSAVGHAGKTAPMSCSPGPSPKKSGVTEQGHGEIIQPEDDQGASDFALAILLQEQERAHFLMSGGGLRIDTPPVGERAEEYEEFYPDDASDEALAWRLMREEEHEDDDEGASEGGGPLGSAPEVESMTYESLLALGELAGNVSKGASQAALDAMQNSVYGESRGVGSCERNDEQCAVCRMEFEKGESVTVLPCSHFYHPDCILQWLQSNKNCPICNTELTTKA